MLVRQIEQTTDSRWEMIVPSFLARAKDRGWKIATLSQLIEDGYILGHLDGNHGNLYPRQEEFVDSGVKYLSANSILNGVVDYSKAKYLTLSRASKFKKGVAKNGDVLFAHNATVGPVAILDTEDDYVIIGTSLTYYRCNEEKINNSYLLNYILNP